MTNYRGISLMSKVYNTILLNRIREPIDKLLRNNQAGFRTGRSCTQQIQILRRIMDGAYMQDIPLFITFIDFKKAFDSIIREMMFAILRHYGITAKIVEAIRVLYDKSTSQVFVEGQLSEPFDITTGVLQGDVLAPFLFIIVIDYVSKQSEGDFGYVTHKRLSSRQPERKLNDLAFADDIALFESSAARAQEQLTVHSANASKVGLEINISKTVQMVLNVPEPVPNAASTNLVLNGQKIEQVDDFKYLGSYVGSTEHDVRARIGLAWTAYWRLDKILSSKSVDLQFKKRLFDAACMSILLYGCETWILTEALKEDLDIYARKCYRMMLGIKQKEAHMTNDALYNKLNAIPISKTIELRQMSFTGHCLRMPDDEPANIYVLYESKVKATNRRGKHRQTYIQQIGTIMCHGTKQLEVNAAEIIKAAKKDGGEFWKASYCRERPKKPPDKKPSKNALAR